MYFFISAKVFKVLPGLDSKHLRQVFFFSFYMSAINVLVEKKQNRVKEL